MSPRRGAAALSASPVLVGAVTVLVTIVAVYLSYNANSGLPFVPTYDLKANVPNAAQLVDGFDVRIGGARVGSVSKIVPRRREDGSTYAQLTLKLDKSVQPLPADSTLLVRPRSALGLKYLQLVPGRDREDGLQAGATIPISQAQPQNVELDEFLDMFDDDARVGARRNLQGFGNGLAGRGRDLNTAIAALVPLLSNLEPVARNLASPRTRLDNFFRSLGRAASEVAPVAGTQADLFVNLDTTFTALASIARPFLQDTISESVPAEETAIRDFPKQRPFLRNSAALFHELQPGVATLPASAPVLADAFDAGAAVLPKTIPFNEDVADVFESLQDFSDDQLAEQGVTQLGNLAQSLKPTLAFLTPAQSVCNYATLWFRNIASLLSEGDSNGTFQRFIIIDPPEGPNAEGGPSSAPANGPSTPNHLHSNPYPNTAAPGQTHECEAGNERYTIGKTVIGNVPGNQGTVTDGQPKRGGGK
jgi:phospholipid/cholesterol/gamma-HCH transport system substrate-binding protein